MKVELHYKSDKEYYTVNEAGNQTHIDMLAMEDKQAMSPTELLLSGVIACAAVDLVQMIKKRRKTFVDLSGVVTGTRADSIPRKFTEIHVHYTIVSPDLTDEEAERLVELATTKYCSVAATINENVKMTHSFEIVEKAISKN